MNELSIRDIIILYYHCLVENEVCALLRGRRLRAVQLQANQPRRIERTRSGERRK